MNKLILGLALVFCFQGMSTTLFANPHELSTFEEQIATETLNIQHAPFDDYHALSNSHASRGENYLMLGDNQKALEDFIISYRYASNCKIQEDDMLFRPLLGAFLSYALLEDLESTRELYLHLDSMLKNNCAESAGKPFHFKTDQCHAVTYHLCQADHPILGPDRIAIKDCIERVETTFEALSLLIAPIKKTEVAILAQAFINQLAKTAHTCCKEGGVWKACLQPMVNKLHYWKVMGVPADPMWD